MIFRIKEAREMAGYSQKELASRIGVAPNTFCGYENGLHDPKSNLLVKIAEACNVSTDFLLGVDIHKNSSDNVTSDIRTLTDATSCAEVPVTLATGEAKQDCFFVAVLSPEERETIDLMRSNGDARAQIMLVKEMHKLKKDTPKD